MSCLSATAPISLITITKQLENVLALLMKLVEGLTAMKASCAIVSEMSTQLKTIEERVVSTSSAPINQQFEEIRAALALEGVEVTTLDELLAYYYSQSGAGSSCQCDAEMLNRIQQLVEQIKNFLTT